MKARLGWHCLRRAYLAGLLIGALPLGVIRGQTACGVGWRSLAAAAIAELARAACFV